MQLKHHGNFGTWGDTGIRGGETGKRDIVGVAVETQPFRYAHICYGCSASFATKAELVAHLYAVHGAYA